MASLNNKKPDLEKYFSIILEKKIYNNLEFQRLEFIGDRILGSILSVKLFHSFKKYNEGKLAKLYAFLTSSKCISLISKEAMLLKFLEKENEDNISNKILSDFMEAIIGYVFLQEGYKKTADIINFLWKNHIIQNAEIKGDNKTVLQEWSQSNNLGLPMYSLKSKTGPDHAPEFEVTLKISNYPLQSGIGKSLQSAEQNAAANFLDLFTEKEV